MADAGTAAGGERGRTLAPSADAIVVLGARVRQGVPSWPLRCRAELGARLLLEGRAPLLVLSGGGDQGNRPEAEFAAEIARAAGAPDAALLLERESRSTHENALYTARLLLARDATRILLVTDPSHLFRACREFERAGFLEVQPAPAFASEAGIPFPDLMRRRISEAVSLARRPWLWFPARRRGGG